MREGSSKGNIEYRQEMELSELLCPYSVDEFFSQDWCRRFKYIKGEANKFKGLIGWEDINKILSRNRLEPPRLRLAFEGSIVPVTEYIDFNESNRSKPIPRLKLVEFTDLLQKGATLVLDSINECYDRLFELARTLEWVFKAHIQMNLYAGHRTVHGFDLHWDDHEVLILQVIGRKSWVIYESTRPYPVKRDIVETPPPDLTKSKPVWEGILETGDVLYIPRGWHHMAVPLDEPTMHITVGISNPTGHDLLRWMSDRLLAKDFVRSDLPRFGSDEDKQRYIELIRNSLIEACDAQLLERYFERHDASTPKISNLSLPWSLTFKGLPEDDHALIRSTSTRPYQVRDLSESNSVEILAMGKKWRFTDRAKIILNILNDGKFHSISELCKRSSGVMNRSATRILLGELVVNGLVEVSI